MAGGSVTGGSVGGGSVAGGSVGGGSVGGGSVGGGFVGGIEVLVGGITVLAGGGIGVHVDLGERVRVGEVAVGEGEGVSVFDGVMVMVGEGEEVNVKMEVSVGVNVLVTVGLFVGVVNIVAKACIVSALSVLCVGVAVFPPVFGMTRSGSYKLSEVKLETMNGKPNAMRQLLTRTTIIK